MGKMTASLSASLAASNPATSSHFTLGLSERMAPASAPRSFLDSGSRSSSSESVLRSSQSSYVRERERERDAVEKEDNNILSLSRPRRHFPISAHGARLLFGPSTTTFILLLLEMFLQLLRSRHIFSSLGTNHLFGSRVLLPYYKTQTSLHLFSQPQEPLHFCERT